MIDDENEDDDDTNYLSIKINNSRFKTWKRDVTKIDFESDLELFKQEITPLNPKIAHVGMYQGIGDHVEVFARTESDIWIKMHMSGAGGSIIYDADGPSSREIDGYTVVKGLDLHGLLFKFYTVAKSRRFSFIEYNCRLFASALILELGVFKGEIF